ncbi:flap endonuclease gen like protein 1 [Diplodia corticola]|uniref:Flap endonuclease gen like protein 1 n=1 Tax=Diplodia corticola TaxID=236234 RepID=A0A1J9RRL8_9PEZI|nr:flap endonuclease gen like protein 1 [Diplodia corticola]OJD35179.1 flap endonuclease gen like protein 1 [Diplodia corticola]
MGINGLWDEVRKKTSARQVDLAVLSARNMRQHGRPLRVAIDVSIDVYKYLNATQRARGAGGMNHPTRTFFYHVLHYMMAGVQPIFIFDGPQRPPTKRDKYVSRQIPSIAPLPPKAATSLRSSDDIQREFEYGHLVDLYHQVLDLLGVPSLKAPGEAEAECAALEKAGIVDAICTKDGDALAFGAVRVFLPCNKAVRKGRTVLPVQVFETSSPSSGSEMLSKEDLVLLAVMAGGDYDHGIPNCGPDLAMAAAKAGYGKSLNAIANSGQFVAAKLQAWRNKLKTDLQKGTFGSRHRAVADRIPNDFPKMKILDLYLRPSVSSGEHLQQLKEKILWNQPIDITRLHDFTKAHFDWKGRHFARKFINALCSPLLSRALLRHLEAGEDATGMFTQIKQSKDAATNESPDELRLEFIPSDIVSIDWQAEPRKIGYDTQFDAKERYNPGEPFRDWFPAFLIEHGAPMQYASWAESPAREESTAKTRKDDPKPLAPSPKSLELPSTKKRCGRPRKFPNEPISEAMDSAQPAPKRKRGRPPKHSTTKTTEFSSSVTTHEFTVDGFFKQNSIASAPRKKLRLLPPISDEGFIGFGDEEKTGGSHEAGTSSSLSMHRQSCDTQPPAFIEVDEDDDVVVLSSRSVGKAPNDAVHPYLGGCIEDNPTAREDSSSSRIAMIPKNRLEKTAPLPRSAVVDSTPRHRRKERALNNSQFIT